jgi:hypothetical protein
MFTSINKLARRKPLLFRGLRETIIASVSGITFAIIVFQAIYVMIFALE